MCQCSLLPEKLNFASSANNGKSSQNNAGKDAVIEIKQDLSHGHYDAVKAKATDFIYKHPQSTYLNETLYLQGLSFEYFEDWDLAMKNYNRVIDMSLFSNKEFLALALYRKAICFEAKHEPELALAALHDALSYKNYLSIEVAEAEIPARMASIFASIGQPVQADYYALIAEKGIRKARSIKKNSEQEWLAYTLLQMGSLPQAALSPENFYENLLGFSRHQKYLLQTIELADSVWSPKAELLLVSSYTDFWNTIQTYNLNPSSDWEMDFVVTAEKRVDMATHLLEALEMLKNFQAPEESKEYANTITVFNKLKPIEELATELVHKQILIKPWQKPLSKDSQIKPQAMTGTFDTSEFEEQRPHGVNNFFPEKKTGATSAKSKVIKKSPKSSNKRKLK